MRLYIFTICLIPLFFSCNSQKDEGRDDHFLKEIFTPSPTVVGIQPLGKFNSTYRDSLASVIEKYYGFEVIVLPPREIPNGFFINVKSPRYRADSLIRWMRNWQPDSLDYIIGITSHDISTTKRDDNGDIKSPAFKYTDWGIFGLGFRPGPTCILSSSRLETQPNSKTILRIQKVGLHELGHNLGLKHCENTSCVMQDAAETVKTVDIAPLGLCEKCLNLID